MDYLYISRNEDMSVLRRWLDGRKRVVVDTETGPNAEYADEWLVNSKIGLDPYRAHMITMQIGNRTSQFIVDLRTVTDIQPLIDLMTNEHVAKIGVNLRFDVKFMMHAWNIIPRQLIDVMLIEQLLRSGIFPLADSDSAVLVRKFTSLFALAKRYLGLEIDKEKELRTSLWKTGPNDFSLRQLEYMAGDCVYPDLILDEQRKLVVERNLTRVVNLENRLIPVIANMELHGIPFDRDYWTGLYQEVTASVFDLERKLDRFFSNTTTVQSDLFANPTVTRRYDYSSSQQLAKALANIGVSGFVDQSGKAESTNTAKIKLMKIDGMIDPELADTLVAYRGAKKKRDSYGDNLLRAINPITSRIHPDFTQCCLVTGRLSCSPGLQTIPATEKYRKAFFAPKGYALIILDASQIEARISADLTGDPPAIEVFKKDLDIYKIDGELMYQRPIIRYTEEGEKLRKRAKVSWLGLSYGQGKRKFNRYCRVFLGEDISQEDTDFLYDKFFEIHAVMKEKMDIWSGAASPHGTNEFFYDSLAESFIDPKVAYGNLMDIYLDRFHGDQYEADKVVKYLLGRRNKVTYTNTVLGRKRFFRADYIGWWTAGRNAPVQGTASDIQKATMLAFQEEHWNSGYDAHIINVIHDEIVTLVREDQADDLLAVQRRLGVETGQKFLKHVPMKLEGGVSDVWRKF